MLFLQEDILFQVQWLHQACPAAALPEPAPGTDVNGRTRGAMGTKKWGRTAVVWHSASPSQFSWDAFSIPFLNGLSTDNSQFRDFLLEAVKIQTNSFNALPSHCCGPRPCASRTAAVRARPPASLPSTTPPSLPRRLLTLSNPSCRFSLMIGMRKNRQGEWIRRTQRTKNINLNNPLKNNNSNVLLKNS